MEEKPEPTVGRITFGAPYNPDNPPPGVTSIGSEGVLKWIGPSAPPKTLRDEFAMAALTGLVSGGTQGDPIPSIAELAYRLADAMLKARAPSQDAA